MNELSSGTHVPLHLKTRAQIILNAAKGMGTNEIKREMKLYYTTVQCWRDRYCKATDELTRIEEETPHKLRSSIEKLLSDEQRSGGPPKFTDEQVAAIIAISCEEPEKFDKPFSHWTPELLRLQVNYRQNS